MVVVVKSGGRRERLANVVETDVLALQSTKHFYILDTKESKVNIVREKERERERPERKSQLTISHLSSRGGQTMD